MATLLTKTPFDNTFVERMKVKFLYDLPIGYSEKIIESIVKTIGTVLHLNPDKNDVTHGIYYNYQSDSNRKMFAGILEFDKNEENPENPGAYEFTLSYDPEIVEKADKTAQDPVFSEMLDSTLMIEKGIKIPDAIARYVICSSVLEYLKEFVENQVNANPNEVVEFEIPGILTISGAIEDNSIVISMLPGADLKSKVVKDDAASEKK